MNFRGLAQMNADGQRAPAIGAGGRDSLARETVCVADRNAVKSAQSYRIPDHYKSNTWLTGDHHRETLHNALHGILSETIEKDG